MSGRADQAPLFVESQRFRSLWMWLPMAVVIAIAANTWRTLGHGPTWPIAMFGLLVVGFVVFLLLLAQLTVEVRSDGVYARFAPFHRDARFFPFDEIVAHRAVTYRPIVDYGGWGIRRGRNGSAYNMSGNRGVLLTFRDGTTLLLGSRRADELDAAIDRGKRVGATRFFSGPPRRAKNPPAPAAPRGRSLS
jgi:hypothetical protein